MYQFSQLRQEMVYSEGQLSQHVMTCSNKWGWSAHVCLYCKPCQCSQLRWNSPYSFIPRSIRVECVHILNGNRKWCTVKVSWASKWWPVTFSGVGLHKPLSTPSHVSAISHWWILHADILLGEPELSVSVFSTETGMVYSKCQFS